MWVFLESDSVKWKKKKKRFLWKNKQKILNELMRMLEEREREREREREIFIENKIRRKRIKIKDIVKITKLFKSY